MGSNSLYWRTCCIDHGPWSFVDDRGEKEMNHSGTVYLVVGIFFTLGSLAYKMLIEQFVGIAQVDWKSREGRFIFATMLLTNLTFLITAGLMFLRWWSMMEH